MNHGLIVVENWGLVLARVLDGLLKKYKLEPIKLRVHQKAKRIGSFYVGKWKAALTFHGGVL